jgi:hypothetical protein
MPRQYKIKEHHVRDVLIEKFPNVEMVFDKQIDNACSKKRPDVRIECFTHTVIIECDENQHKGYSCENKRIMEIFTDLGSRPLVMIRFNPDKYDEYPSCFNITKSGSLSLNKKEWNKRTQVLIVKIQENMEIVPKKEITEITLFYNT